MKSQSCTEQLGATVRRRAISVVLAFVVSLCGVPVWAEGDAAPQAPEAPGAVDTGPLQPPTEVLDEAARVEGEQEQRQLIEELRDESQGTELWEDAQLPEDEDEERPTQVYIRDGKVAWFKTVPLGDSVSTSGTWSLFDGGQQSAQTSKAFGGDGALSNQTFSGQARQQQQTAYVVDPVSDSGSENLQQAPSKSLEAEVSTDPYGGAEDAGDTSWEAGVLAAHDAWKSGRQQAMDRYLESVKPYVDELAPAVLEVHDLWGTSQAPDTQGSGASALAAGVRERFSLVEDAIGQLRAQESSSQEIGRLLYREAVLSQSIVQPAQQNYLRDLAQADARFRDSMNVFALQAPSNALLEISNGSVSIFTLPMESIPQNNVIDTVH